MTDDPALARLRMESAARLAGLRAEFDRVVTATDGANADDEHDPEGATIAFERSQLSALIEQATARLSELDRAIQRLAEGRYGVCEVCGGAIAPERLQARPAAARCIRCAV